jgi:hypothetical protein
MNGWSAKDEGGVNLALFIESDEVEGVHTNRWRKKDSVMRLIGITEMSRAGSAAEDSDHK